MIQKNQYIAPLTDIMLSDMQIMKDYDYSGIPDPHQDPAPQRISKMYI